MTQILKRMPLGLGILTEKEKKSLGLQVFIYQSSIQESLLLIHKFPGYLSNNY